jgi:hypothetical protein
VGAVEVVVFAILWLLPIVVAWFVVYTAVLAALRRHDRGKVLRP